MQDSGCSDHALQELYTTWRTAESKAHRIFDQTNDDYSDLLYIEAEKQSAAALTELLRKPTSSLHGIMLKLRIACQYEDFMAEALDPACGLVAPRAIVAAMHDLENLIITPYVTPETPQRPESA